MAEVLVSPLLNLVSENVSSMIRQEISLMPGVNKELGKLSSTISIIKEVVEDAEVRQAEERDAKIWLEELKEAAYDADDILDEYATEALRLRVEGRGSNHTSQVCNFFSPCLCIKKGAIRRDILHKIKQIRNILQKIAMEGLRFNLLGNVLEGRQRQELGRETHAFVDESMVLGREAEKEKVLELLLSTKYDVGVGVCVIPIVGLGGIGKTTLAQSVFNDERVERNFELRMWVCVLEENFDLQRILNRIIQSATHEDNQLHDSDSFRHRLLETLKEKRYLLVLDDVWNMKEVQWGKLRPLLGCGASGSRIIVTTRSERVSSIMSTVDPIHLQALSEEDCFLLFETRAFLRDGHERIPPNLVEIGKEMVRKCRGLPLAIKILGSLVYFKRDEVEWLSILQSGTMDIPEDENGLNSIRISYNHLPLYLKSCFMFCSIFPRDYKFEKDTLIKIWMAEGFIQPSKRVVLMEDVACQYFNELLFRSFFQDVEKDVDGNIISCKMHDLFHDLAQYISGDECKMIDFSISRFISDKVRHSSLVDYDFMVHTTTLQRLYKCKKLRTILNLGEGGMVEESLNSLFLNFRCLRVLDLGSGDITELPYSIGNLKYLRYLNISRNQFRTLPESICSLWNLETLKILHCVNFFELPKGMENLINLRHLEIDSDNQLNCMPIGIGKLTRLQTLSIFFVGKESGALIGELQGLNLLRGNLEIRNVENIRNIEDAKEAILKNRECLRFLVFHWCDWYEVSSEEEQAVVEGVFEALQPHTNLERLSIEGYKGDKFPSWMGDSSFTNLVRVDLYNCKRSKRLPPFGWLNSLKHLTISGVDGVKHLNDDINDEGNRTRFPSLEFLALQKMPSLEELVRNGEGAMTSLLTLKIESCPNLRLLPHLPFPLHLQILNHCKLMSSSEGLLHLTSLKTLELLDCDEIALTLEHHPTLETLLISDCPHLTSLPDGLLQNLAVFQSLEIRHCPKLTSLPERLENLISLRSLSFIGCDELVSLPQIMQHLSTVQGLRFDGSTNLPSSSSSDKAWTRLTELKTLCITYKLGSLQYLIPYSTTFESLYIYNCPKVESLPDALETFTTLQNIDILGCPLLENRCREGGKDWYKIAHVPNNSIQNLPMTSAAFVTDELVCFAFLNFNFFNSYYS